MILDALAQNRWSGLRRHDVGDLHARRRQRAQLAGSAFSALPITRKTSGMAAKSIGIDLGRAAGDDDLGTGPLALDAANGLPRLPHRFRRHRAGVDDDEIASPVRQGGAAHGLRLDKIEPAAEGQDFDVLWFAPRRYHAAMSLKRTGSRSVSNSNSTGPVIVTWPSLSRHSISRSPPGRLTMALAASEALPRGRDEGGAGGRTAGAGQARATLPDF